MSRLFLLLGWFCLLGQSLLAQKQVFDAQQFQELMGEFIQQLYADTDLAASLLEDAQQRIDPDDEHLQAKLWNLYGRLAYVRGDYPSSLRYHSLALPELLEREDYPFVANSYNGFGLVFLGQQDYVKAIEWFEKAKTINLRLKEFKAASANLFNIGVSLTELKFYPQAMRSLEEAIEMAVQENHLQIELMALNRKAEVHYHMEQYEQALFFFKECLAKNSINNNWEKIFAWAGMSQVYMAQGNLQTAYSYAIQSLALAQEMKALWDATKAAGILTNVLEKQQRYKEALDTHRLHKQLQDSLYSTSKAKEINTLMLRQQKLENEALSAAKELAEFRQKKSLWIILVLVFVLIALGVLLFMYFKSVQRYKKSSVILQSQNLEILDKNLMIEEQNRLLSQINNTKDRLFSVISHDLRGPMGALQQVFELKAQGLLSEEDQTKMEGLLTEKVSKMRLLLENLLDWAQTQMEGVNIKPIELDLPLLVQDAQDTVSLVANNKGITFINQLEAGTVLADQRQMTVVFQNVISNSLKYSFPDSEIHFTGQPRGAYYHLQIRDFGKGMDAAKVKSLMEENDAFAKSEPGTANEQGSGLGMLLIRQFVFNNKGKLEISSKPGVGTTVSIRIPLAK